MLLDVFYNDGASNAPVIILIHGQASDKGDWGTYRPFFLGLGFIVVLPQWQGSTATSTDPIADIGLAYTWVQQNIATYGGDPTRINIGGSSAGAYIAGMEAYARELGFRSFVGLAGLYRSDPFINGLKERVLDFVNTNDPPAFLCHGDADTTAPPAESTAMSNRLTTTGVENHLNILPGISHPDIKTAVFLMPEFQSVRDDLGLFLQTHNDIALPPTISAVASDANAAEPGLDTGLITIARAGSADATVTVNYTVAGTATAGADYTSLTGTVTLAATQLSTNLIIRALNDALAECEETVLLTIAPGIGYFVDPTNATAIVRIADNDLPVTRIAASDSVATEAGDPGTFLVTRSGCTNAALTVNYTVAGTATAGTDYALLAGTIVIPAGTNAQSILVAPATDAIAEPDETVVVTLATGAGYNVSASNSTATVTIQDGGVPVQPTLARSPAALPAQTIVAGDTALNQSFHVWNAGTGAFGYTISDDAPWVSVNPANGNASGTVTNAHTVQYLTDNLPPGDYSATITITATNGALDSPQTVTAMLTIRPCDFTINPTQRAFGRGAGTGTISVATSPGCAWFAASNDPWLSITGGNTGTGSGVVSYAVSANTGCDARAGTLTVAGQTFSVTQAAGIGTITFNPTSRQHGGGAETGSITVSASASNCAWTAVASADWLTVTGGASGTGSGVVTYSVDANPTCTARAGSLTIAGQAFSVTQAAGVETFTIDPLVSRYDAGATNGTVAVTASSQDCDWSATSNDGWITITGGATGLGDGVVTYDVAANDSCNARNGTMTVAGVTFVVTQGAATGNYEVTPAGRVHGAAAEAGSFTVMATPGDCGWVATTTNNWIAITSGAGTGTGVVTYAVASNANLTVRSGAIAVQGQTFAVVQDPLPGTGLLGEYFAGTDTLTQRLVRVDGAVDFDWGNGSPDASVPTDGFSARWTGRVMPRFSETYTFELVADGGVRLWVNNSLLIENWTDTGSKTVTGDIALTAGALYSIAVEYFDKTGSANAKLSWSSASQAKEIVPSPQLYPASTGLVAEYFTGTNLVTRVLTRTEPQLDFNWGTGSPDALVPTNGFSARWSGQIVPRFSETYTFSTVSDDGVRLWVNGVGLVTNWTNHGATTNSGTITLVAGQRYDIKMEHYDAMGSAVAKLLWASPSEPRAPVPTTALWPQVRGLMAEYYTGTNLSTRVMTRAEPQLNFEWAQGGPAPIVGTNNFSARWSGQVTPRFSETYTFSTVSDDGIRLWVNGAALVTNWTNHGATTNSGTITLVAGRRYDIKMEYYDATGNAVAKLLWSSARQTREVIPAIQLSLPTNGTVAAQLPAASVMAGASTFAASSPAPATDSTTTTTALRGVRLIYAAPPPATKSSSVSGGRMIVAGCADLTGRWLLAGDEYVFTASAPCFYESQPPGWLRIGADNHVDAFLDEPLTGVFDPAGQTLYLHGADFDLTGTRP